MIDCCIPTYINPTAFELSVKVNGNRGEPIAGRSIYQNDVLKNALDVHYIFLAKTIFTILDGDFNINTTTGEVDISPNVFVSGDTLIIRYKKNI